MLYRNRRAAARPSRLVCGSAGCGKTLLAIEFLLRGAMEYDEPGVFMSFEEKKKELAANVLSLGLDLQDLKEHKKIEADTGGADQGAAISIRNGGGRNKHVD